MIASTVPPVGRVNVGIIKAKGMAALFQEGVCVVFMLSVDAISSPTQGPTVEWLVITSHAKLSVLENVNP